MPLLEALPQDNIATNLTEFDVAPQVAFDFSEFWSEELYQCVCRKVR
jgi:hypothetical protein